AVPRPAVTLTRRPVLAAHLRADAARGRIGDVRLTLPAPLVLALEFILRRATRRCDARGTTRVGAELLDRVPSAVLRAPPLEFREAPRVLLVTHADPRGGTSPSALFRRHRHAAVPL